MQSNYVHVNVILEGLLVVQAVKKITVKFVATVKTRINYLVFLSDASILRLANSVFSDSICTRVSRLEIS